MASRTLAYQGESGLCNSPDPLEEPTVDGEGRGHGVGPHQESCHDRRLQHRLGGAVRRQTDLRPLVEDGERLPHQLLGNASSLSSLPVFPAGPNRTPCADSLRQNVRGVLYKSPGRCLLEAPLYSGRTPSGMGSAQSALVSSISTPAGQTEGADMLSRSNVPSEEWMLHPQVVQKIWKTFGKAEVDFFASKDNSHCPTYYSKDRDRLFEGQLSWLRTFI